MSQSNIVIFEIIFLLSQVEILFQKYFCFILQSMEHTQENQRLVFKIIQTLQGTELNA